jgi:hypothetical protein
MNDGVPRAPRFASPWKFLTEIVSPCQSLVKRGLKSVDLSSQALRLFETFAVA